MYNSGIWKCIIMLMLTGEMFNIGMYKNVECIIMECIIMEIYNYGNV